MTLARLLTQARLLAGFFVALSVVCAQAQWQVPNYAVPVGKGAGITGFTYASPSTSGYVLMSNGASAVPSFQGFQQAGATAAIRTFVEKDREIFSVADFSGATATAQFNNAVTEACALTTGTGAAIWVPRGQYTLTSTITVPCDNVVFWCEGGDTTKITRNFTSGHTFSFTKAGTVTPTVQTSGVGVINCSFLSTGTLPSASSFHVNVDNAQRVLLANTKIHSGSSGVRLAAVSESWIVNPFYAFYDGGTTTGRYGISYESTSTPGVTTAYGGNNWIIAPEIWGGTANSSTGVITPSLDYAINVKSGDGLQILGGHAFNTALAIVRLNRTSATDPLANVYTSEFMVDHAKCFGLLIDGTQVVSKVRWSGQFSTLGWNDAGCHGLAVSGPLNDAVFNVSIEGYKGSCAYIGNSNAANIVLNIGAMGNCDAANAGNLGGVDLAECIKCTVNLGAVYDTAAIGPTGPKMDFAVRLGASTNGAVVSSGVVSDIEGTGVIAKNGATNFVIGNILVRNAGSATIGRALDIELGATNFTIGNVMAANNAATSRDQSGAVTKKIKGVSDLADYPTLTVAEGGTGFSSYTIGDLLYASGATTLSKLADVATGNALISGGVATAPSWGKIGLTTHVSGTLAEGNGGTNQSTYATGDTLYASASNTLSKLTGNTTTTRKFLRQTGNGSASAAPAWDTIVAADVPGSALTKTDDTNVTLTLGGSPTTALLNAASLTLGWTGQLSVARGGTGLASGTSGGIPYYSGSTTLASSAALGANCIVYGGGAGTAPATSSSTCPTVSSAGVLTVPNTTDSSTTTSGAVILSGGIGIAKNAFAKSFIAIKDISGVGDYAIAVEGATNQNKQVWFGFDTTSDRGFMQAIFQGVGYKTFLLNPSGGNVVIGASSDGNAKFDVTGDILASTTIRSTGATSGMGYATGAGGTVTQATSKSTAVTLNTVTGTITMNNAALASGAIVTFTWTNSAVASTDQIYATHESGGTTGAYAINCRATGSGTAACDVRNGTAGSLSEAIVIRFSVHKSVNSFLLDPANDNTPMFLNKVA